MVGRLSTRSGEFSWSFRLSTGLIGSAVPRADALLQLLGMDDDKIPKKQNTLYGAIVYMAMGGQGREHPRERESRAEFNKFLRDIAAADDNPSDTERQEVPYDLNEVKAVPLSTAPRPQPQNDKEKQRAHQPFADKHAKYTPPPSRSQSSGREPRIEILTDDDAPGGSKSKPASMHKPVSEPGKCIFYCYTPANRSLSRPKL